MGNVTRIPRQMRIDAADFQAYLETEGDLLAKVVDAAEFEDELLRELFDPQDRRRDALLPWGKYDGIAFRPGEMTLWAGPNGSGKSLVVSLCQLSMVEQGEIVVSASFEMSPINQLKRMARQFSGGRDPTPDAVRQLMRFLRGRLYFYDQRGVVQSKFVLALIRYSAKKLQATQVFVDSLMKIVRGETDYDQQKDVVSDLTDVARDYGPHVHLVHHTKKLDDESRIPTKADAKGAGGITDLVDNVIMVWRNKPKELTAQKRDNGVELGDHDMRRLESPDEILVIDKQRNGEFEGHVRLWFDPASMQYRACKELRRLEFAYQGEFE